MRNREMTHRETVIQRIRCDTSTALRFWAKVDAGGGAGACWPWLASKERGYGKFGVNGSNARAHRIAYELAFGDVAGGMVLDHLCRNRACVNPLHLEAVSNKDNLMRGAGNNGALYVHKTHCNKGHPLIPENLYLRKVMRRERDYQCKTCSIERASKARRDRLTADVARRAAVSPP
jgi:hypothetical protein